MKQITNMVADIEIKERDQIAEKKNKEATQATNRNKNVDRIYTEACFLGDALLEDIKKADRIKNMKLIRKGFDPIPYQYYK